jgi:hypothetical protein
MRTRDPLGKFQSPIGERRERLSVAHRFPGLGRFGPLLEAIQHRPQVQAIFGFYGRFAPIVFVEDAIRSFAGFVVQTGEEGIGDFEGGSRSAECGILDTGCRMLDAG